VTPYLLRRKSDVPGTKRRLLRRNRMSEVGEASDIEEDHAV